MREIGKDPTPVEPDNSTRPHQLVTLSPSASMRSLTTIFACLSVLALSTTGIEAQKPEDEIMAVVTRLFDGMRAGDSAMVRSVFHPQARMITVATRQGQLRTSFENGVDGFATAVGTPHPEKWDETIWNEKIQIDGALASVWVDYAFHLGAKFSHCGVDHFLLTKETGLWKIVELADTRRTEGCERR